MHLKTLTLRGFKSFASATTLEFEPGVTCVVGPNGSGKSNVVDALAWVMGEQGAKTLRGGNMADVIFAGTSGRAPLGRAEVALTIDNTDGALPIDYTEVTISRTLFRSGGSEYAINGSACRLLDIQDLLSDSGLGREMHVIVGQGQLDAVLRATPEDRRHFIEEAAGILKHRRRKDKALRKLDSMQANLTRAQDLTAEIRRQLGPLGRQAEVARQAQRIQVDVRDSRSRLLADDIARLGASMNEDSEQERALEERRAVVERALEQARGQLVTLERAAAEATPALTRANDTFYRLSAIRERLRNLSALAEERVRILGSHVDSSPPTDLVDLDEQVERARSARAELDAEVTAAAADLETAIEDRKEAEEAAFASERHHATLLRSVADRREGVARLAGQVAAKRSRVEGTEAEIARLGDQRTAADARAHEATTEFQMVETQAAVEEPGGEGLDVLHADAATAWEDAKAALSDLKDALHQAMRDRDAHGARAEALELSLIRKDGAGALLAAGSRAIEGSVAALIEVSAEAEDAIAAALGPLADALVVATTEDAVDAIRWLRDEDAGRARFLVSQGAGVGAGVGVGAGTGAGTGAAATADAAASTRPTLPAGALWAADLVTAPERLAHTLRELLGGVAVVEDLAAARAVATALPQVTAVTRRGDVLGPRIASGGAGDAPSIIHMQAALDEARTGRDQAISQVELLDQGLAQAAAKEREARAHQDGTLARLGEADARMAAVAEQLGRLGAQARAAQAEAERIDTQVAEAHARMAADAAELEELASRLAAAQAEPEQFEADTQDAASSRARDEQAAKDARARETDARLALRTSEERARALAARAEGLLRAATAEREARERAELAAQRRERQARSAHEVIAGAADSLAAIDMAVAQADDARAAVEALRAERTGALTEVRRSVENYAGEYARLTDDAHRDEVARAELRVRLEQFRQRAVDELGMDPDQLVADYGPDVPVPSADDSGGDSADDSGGDSAVPFVREEQEKRLRHAERAMAQLGKVNPLALEEFAALEERHKFLTDQLADIKRSREDLLQIVKEIDARVEQVFGEAFADTAAQFERIFPRLFPGGEGRIVLTEPGNLLTTGIEIEARPAGKKVKRLSLLSGGERSLTAVALLVSIFKARPSPFYVMDEVEAALDDVNLGRLLEIFRELRDDSQLIVITHQKRTMEIADALYGVTMRGDGVTTVISQRLTDEA